MVEYFVRLNRKFVIQYHEFCTRHGLDPVFLSSGFIGSHVNTVLFKSTMAKADVTALKLAIPVIIMETQS